MLQIRWLESCFVCFISLSMFFVFSVKVATCMAPPGTKWADLPKSAGNVSLGPPWPRSHEPYLAISATWDLIVFM